jgi:hypothetical protein
MGAQDQVDDLDVSGGEEDGATGENMKADAGEVGGTPRPAGSGVEEEEAARGTPPPDDSDIDSDCTVPAVVFKESRLMLRDVIKKSMLVNETAGAESSVIKEDRQMVQTHFDIEGGPLKPLGKWMLRLTLDDHVFDGENLEMEQLEDILTAMFHDGQWIFSDENDYGCVSP